MRRAILLALPVVLLFSTVASSAPRVWTPQRTLSLLVRGIMRGDRALEWGTLSPGFKKRLNEMAGRNVDVGDYTTFRDSQRTDPQIRKMESIINTARITGLSYDGRGFASVIIRFGGPLFFGQSIRVQMVNHKLWVLFVKGEREPYWGFDGDKAIEAVPGKDKDGSKDGSYTVLTRSKDGKVTWQASFPKEKVVRYITKTRWYFNNFGAMEREFFAEARTRS